MTKKKAGQISGQELLSHKISKLEDRSQILSIWKAISLGVGGEYLMRKHDNLLLVDIYTSEEAFKHRNDFKYSVDKYFSGYIMHAFMHKKDECQITSFIKQ